MNVTVRYYFKGKPSAFMFIGREIVIDCQRDHAGKGVCVCAFARVRFDAWGGQSVALTSIRRAVVWDNRRSRRVLRAAGSICVE